MYFLSINLILLRISNYGIASTNSASFILGGFIGNTYDAWRTSTIAKFQNNQWSKFGDLMEIKSCPTAIFNNGEYLITGGEAHYKSGR